MFRKLDLFPSSGEGGKTPALLGPVERSNLNHYAVSSNLLSPHLSWVRIFSSTPSPQTPSIYVPPLIYTYKTIYYLLTKLTITQLVKKFPTFHGT
jgi:hypothetical protein